MKKWIAAMRPATLFALRVIVFAGCRSTKATGTLDVLRKIKIERGTILRLGDKVPPTSDFCNWSGATCALKGGTFAGAETMSLSRTGSGLIYQFQFYYGIISADAMKAQIDDYTHLLGNPSRDSLSKAGQLDSRELEWSDSATTFELSYKYGTDQSQAEASATLTDNMLAKHAR